MLWPNLAEQAVERAKSDYYKIVMGKWRKGRALALQYYNGHGYLDYQEYIEAKLRKQIPLANNNIVKRIIERVSQVYTVPPIRTIGEEPATDYTDYIPGINTELQRVERITNLLNLVAVKPTRYGDHIEIDLITDFDVYLDPDDPLKPIAMSYPLPSAPQKPELTMYIDAGGWRKFDNNGKIYEQEDHNYGILPVYFHYKEKPISDFFDVDYARDLVDACREINVVSIDRTANERFQSYGYLYASGVDGSEEIKTGPNKLTTFRDPQAKLGIVTPPDTQDSTTNTINSIYKAIARNWHLPDDFVEGNVQAESGVARKLRAQELSDDRMGDLESCRDLEDGLYKIAQKMWPVEFNKTLKDGFACDFRENEMNETEEEKRARWDYEIANGLNTWANIMATEINPDKFADEPDPVKAAEEFIMANAKSNGSVKKVSDGRTNIVADILGA